MSDRPPDAAPRFRQIAFVGLGVVSGALARDARRLGLAERIVALLRRPAAAEQALACGLVDAASQDPAILRGAELVVLGVPVGALGEAAQAVAPVLGAGTVVTDIAAVKARAIELVAPHLDARRFVPGHPVVGGKAGWTAAEAEPFRNCRCILTPSGATDPTAVERVAALWRAVGAEVEIMEAARHDRIVAAVAQLPHLLACNAVTTASDVERALQGEVLKYAAGGFLDLARAARADPRTGPDAFMHNRVALLEIVGRYVENLAALQRAIRRGEAASLHAQLATAQTSADWGQPQAAPRLRHPAER